MPELPPPRGSDVPVADRIRQLDELVGRDRFVEICSDLLGGAPRTSYPQELHYLTGNAFADGDVPDPESWKDYWLATHDLPRVRSQAVRTLGHVGDTEHVGIVRAALGDLDPAVRAQAASAWTRMAKRLDLPGQD